LIVLKRMKSSLAIMRQDLERQLRDTLAAGENAEREPGSLRLQALLRQVELTQAEAHRAIATQFDADLAPVVAVEAEFISRLAQATTGIETELFAPVIGTDVRLATVSAPQLYSAVMSNPLQGKTLREWTKQLELGDRQRVRQQITLGYLEGESVQQVVKRVRQVGGITERGAETLARTSMTHINARAVEQNAKVNPSLFKEYQWLSVLDNRTTDICKSRAGKVFIHGSSPLPPAHPNCRSTIYSLVQGVKAPDNLGYETWLRSQPDDVARDILGQTRFKLWKDGTPVERFVEGNRSLTIAQLKARDEAAFERAMKQ
jgi:SPP1 gp7 family putative phage head morphogenesis protein